MRITPIEIRQKTFEKNFRGYDKDEVTGFLQTLSQEWERIMDENKELRIRLEATEREVTKLREVENSLYKTLKTAEDTGAHVIEQARAAAELHLKEIQLKADAILQEAKTKAKDVLEESEVRAKEVVAEMEDRLRQLSDNYKKLESAREDLLLDLKRLANDMLERVERSKQMAKDFDPDKHVAAARREARKVAFPNIDFAKETTRKEHVAKVGNQIKLEVIKEEPAEQPEQEKRPENPQMAIKTELVVEKEAQMEKVPVFADTPSERKAPKSFFDEIG